MVGVGPAEEPRVSVGSQVLVIGSFGLQRGCGLPRPGLAIALDLRFREICEDGSRSVAFATLQSAPSLAPPTEARWRI
jgi:hypothetical protein